MHLLNPIGLLLLLTIPPVVLLYLLKLRRAEVKVPSVFLWEQLIKDLQANAPLQKLRISLLLILQVLVLAALALTFARPFVEKHAVAGASIVLILDGSLSMQSTDVRPSRFEAARREALKIVNELPRGDQMMVAEAGAKVRVRSGFTSNKTVLRRALQACQPADVACDLRDAIVLALSLAEKKRKTRVIVLSDGAFSKVTDVHLPPGFEVDFMKFGDRANNVAITGLDVRQRLAAGGGNEIFVAVDNFSNKQVRCALEIYHDDALIKAKPVTIPADGRAVEVLRDLRLESGVIRARVDAHDDLPRDNETLAVLRPRPQMRVLLVTQGNPFLERVLNVIPNCDLSTTTPGNPLPANSEDFDVVVFDGSCPNRVGQGKFLFFGDCPGDGPVEIVSTQEQPAIIDWDRNHSLLRYVQLGYPHVLIAKANIGRVRPWARSLAETSQGPIIALGERRGVRCVWVGFVVKDSNLPLRAGFPIFMSNAVEWLTGEGDKPIAQRHPTGQPLRIEAPAELEELTVSGPNGLRRTVRVDQVPVLFNETDYQGIYRAIGRGFDERFAVCIVDRTESDSKPRSEIHLSAGGPPTQAGPAKSNREVWRWVLLFVVLLMVAEWWVYHSRL